MKLNKDKKKLKFRTTQTENASKRRKIVLAFVILTLVVAAISVFMLTKEYGLFSKENKKDNPDVTAVPNVKMSKNVTVLFAGTTTDKSQVVFASCITLNTEKRKFSVGAIDVGSTYKGKNLSQIYVKDNEQGLTDAVAALYNIKIDRYVVVTEKDIKPFIGALGQFEVDLFAPIDYQGDDFSLNLLSGEQTLSGDKLFKYIRYVGLDGSNSGLQSQSQIIADLISQELNENNAEKGDELFGTLVNNCTSNITIIDFSKYRQLLLQISKEPKDVTVKLYSVEE